MIVSRKSIPKVGLKPVVTWATASALDICREACGGHGYAAVNRLGELRDDHDIWKTFEGDNTVLLQQVAGELVKQYGKDVAKQGVVWFYLRRALRVPGDGDPVATSTNLREPGFQRRLFEHAKLDYYTLLCDFRNLRETWLAQFEAWSRCMNHLLKLAKAHVERVILEKFVQKVARVQADSPGSAHAVALKRLCDLYALTLISDH